MLLPSRDSRLIRLQDHRTRTTLVLLAMMLQAACKPEASVRLVGAGATLPLPFAQWIRSYQEDNPAVAWDYTPADRNRAIALLRQDSIDFLVTGIAMTDEEIAGAGGNVLHIPVLIGAVAAVYHLAGVADLLLTREVLAAVLRGQITAWNDPRIVAINPGLALPASDIAVIRQADAPAIARVFFAYLGRADEQSDTAAEEGTPLARVVGREIAGTASVVEAMRLTPGALGFVDYSAALLNDLPVARIRNRRGNYVGPSPTSISLASDSLVAAVTDHTDLRASLLDQRGLHAYPITSFTWLVLHRDQTVAQTARHLASWAGWVVKYGAVQAPRFGYAPLPDRLMRTTRKRLESISVDGEPEVSRR